MHKKNIQLFALSYFVAIISLTGFYFFQDDTSEKVQETMENGERRRRKDVQVVREEMEAKLEHMLDATTRTTITENSRMTTELQYLSHRVTQLLHNNKRLTKKNKYLTRELSLESWS